MKSKGLKERQRETITGSSEDHLKGSWGDTKKGKSETAKLHGMCNTQSQGERQTCLTKKQQTIAETWRQKFFALLHSVGHCTLGNPHTFESHGAYQTGLSFASTACQKGGRTTFLSAPVNPHAPKHELCEMYQYVRRQKG